MDPNQQLGNQAIKELKFHRDSMRHSAAHIMADAVMALFPSVKVGIGPSTEDGFYYDFETPRPFTPEDLETIEATMRKIIKDNAPFQRELISRDTAKKIFNGQPYKLEIIEDISEDEQISIYRHGAFVDLCKGPHVESTGDIIAFKLLSIAGAYWKGDENRVPMLQRIYGTAFESKDNLNHHIDLLEQADLRDHRKLGRKLDLFSIHEEIGPGLVVWHPKGGRLRSIIQDYWHNLHLQHDYETVYSPHLGKSNLWETSGHLDFYSENMYSPMDLDGQVYYIKPMNCPFHIMIYKSGLRSYRDLPLKLGELGTVYRYERSGVLHGLLRVRGFTQDDAHIFCRPDQVEHEIVGVLDLTFELFKAFGFTDYEISLSTKPDKSVGDLDQWEYATKSLESALELRELEFDIDEGGGAFYGPKIDIKIRDALGRAWQCTTIQFDFNLPQRFDLTFQGDDGNQHRPYMIHRAILGSVERFVGILIEHYAGAFPVWLSPVQVVIIPIADRHLEYANNISNILKNKGIRVETDSRKERMNQKIRSGQLQKIPYMVIVGDQEVDNASVSPRSRDGENMGSMSVDELVDVILNQINSFR